MPHSRYEPMNTATLMDAVFDVYKRSFSRQLAFSAIIGVISFVLMIVLGVVVGVAAIMPYINNPEAAMTGMIFAMLAVMLPIYLIWTATADAGHILLSRQAFYKQPIRLPARQLPRITLRVLGATLAQLILSAPWIVIIAFVFFRLFRSAGDTLLYDPTFLLNSVSSVAWTVLSIAGTLVYVVYSNIFALAVPVAVFERRTFFNAISRSYRLTRGAFWKILGARILWSVTVQLFSYSAQGLWASVTGFINTVSGSTLGVSPFMNLTGSLLQSIVSIIIGFLIGPLSGILTALIYFNQRIKKEGLDIEIELERLKS